MTEIAAYILSAYSFINKQSLNQILDTGYQSKDGNAIPSFDEDLLIQLCSDAQRVFENEESILNIEGDLIVIGDIHGSLHDLLRILYYIKDSKSKVLFLGDYVDRGHFSLECITILLALKVMNPETYYLLRGNHEFDIMCSQYGFKNEILNYHNPKKTKELIIKKPTDFLCKFYEEQREARCDEYYADHNDANCFKYTEKLYESFIQVFSYLPIGAIANNTTFCIHGGISPRLERIEALKKSIIRPIDKYEDNHLFSDILWSDPSKIPCLYGDNPRGRGYLFSTDAVDLFLRANKLKRIIRGHQCVQNGTVAQFNEKCITVFSASSYSREMENNSGILQIYKEKDELEYITFSPLKRLQKIDAIYYKVQNLNNIKKNQSCFSIKHPKLTTSINSRICVFYPRSIKPNCSDLSLSRFSNLMFITNSKKSNRFAIKRPHICNSTSMCSLNFENENDNNNNEIPIVKSMFLQASPK